MILNKLDFERANLMLYNTNINYNVLGRWKLEAINTNLIEVINIQLCTLNGTKYIPPNVDVDYIAELTKDINEYNGIITNC